MIMLNMLITLIMGYMHIVMVRKRKRRDHDAETGVDDNAYPIADDITLMWQTQCQTPSSSHHHFYGCYMLLCINHPQMLIVALGLPHDSSPFFIY